MLKSILGKDFPEHICKNYDSKHTTDKLFLIEILTDRKPFVMIFYRYFSEPKMIIQGTKPKTAREQLKEFTKKFGQPLLIIDKRDGLKAVYDCIKIKYCPFCGEKLYYTSRKKYMNKLLPKKKNPELIINHKIKDFDSLRNNHSKICSLSYRINSKKHKHNDVDFKLWLEGLPKYPDIDCYEIIHYILSMCNPYYIYLPRPWNVCIENNDKYRYFKDMLPHLWYQSDKRYIKFGKPKGKKNKLKVQG